MEEAAVFLIIYRVESTFLIAVIMEGSLHVYRSLGSWEGVLRGSLGAGGRTGFFVGEILTCLPLPWG